MATFPAAILTPTTVTTNDDTTSPSHVDLHNDIQDEVVAVQTKLGIDSSTNDATVDYFMETSWRDAPETFAYVSADDPVFVMRVTGSDVTAKYPVGTKFWLNQTTDKYFIVVKSEFTGGNTDLTIYGGTDYDLANATITNPRFSRFKAPRGFPLDPTKWTVTLTDTTQRSQASPVANTWYNSGSLSLAIPIGVWNVEFSGRADVDRAAAGAINIFATLSTANNSESDTDFGASAGNANLANLSVMFFRRKTLVLTTKTTYYVNHRTTVASMTNIYLTNATSKLIVRAVCAYL